MIRKVAGAILARGWEVFVEDRKTPVLSRRAFLQAMAATGVVAACGSGTPGGTAKISGTITVSYPDELGLKPKYVDQAATALKSRYSGLDVKVDLQKISSGDYYTKLLLALSGGGDVPDVIHVGGDRIGELADAGYIEPLERRVTPGPRTTASYRWCGRTAARSSTRAANGSATARGCATRSPTTNMPTATASRRRSY